MRKLVTLALFANLCSGLSAQERLWSYDVQPLCIPAGIDIQQLDINRIPTSGAFAFVDRNEERLFTWDPGGGFVERTGQAIGSVPGLIATPRFDILDVTSAGTVLFGLTGNDVQGGFVFGNFLLNIETGSLTSVDVTQLPISTIVRANGSGTVTLRGNNEYGLWQAGSYMPEPSLSGRVGGQALDLDDSGRIWVTASDVPGGQTYSWGFFDDGVFTALVPVFFSFSNPFGVVAHDGGSSIAFTGIQNYAFVIRGSEIRPLQAASISSRALLGDGATYRILITNPQFGDELQVELFDGTVLDLPSMWNQNRPFSFSFQLPGTTSRNSRAVGAGDSTILMGPAYFDLDGEPADFVFLKRSSKPALHVECVGSNSCPMDRGLRLFPPSNNLEFRIRGGIAGQVAALVPVINGTGTAPLPIGVGILDSTGGLSISIPNVSRTFTTGLRAIALDPVYGLIQSPVMRLRVE